MCSVKRSPPGAHENNSKNNPSLPSSIHHSHRLTGTPIYPYPHSPSEHAPSTSAGSFRIYFPFQGTALSSGWFWDYCLCPADIALGTCLGFRSGCAVRSRWWSGIRPSIIPANSWIERLLISRGFLYLCRLVYFAQLPEGNTISAPSLYSTVFRKLTFCNRL